MFGGDSGLDFKATQGQVAYSPLALSTNNTEFQTTFHLNFTTFKMTVPSFETIFAVPMTCQSCINDIEGSLQQLSGMSDPVARHSASDSM
jgi:hypothetical protein